MKSRASTSITPEVMQGTSRSSTAGQLVIRTLWSSRVAPATVETRPVSAGEPRDEQPKGLRRLLVRSGLRRGQGRGQVEARHHPTGRCSTGSTTTRCATPCLVCSSGSAFELFARCDSHGRSHAVPPAVCSASPRTLAAAIRSRSEMTPQERPHVREIVNHHDAVDALVGHERSNTGKGRAGRTADESPAHRVRDTRLELRSIPIEHRESAHLGRVRNAARPRIGAPRRRLAENYGRSARAPLLVVASTSI